MTTALGLFLLATGVFYAVRLMLWRRGLHLEFERSDALPTPRNAALPTITVVIAARDEEATIGPCVDSVLATDYPREKLEVIVVDDDSSDQTAAIVRQRMLRAPALAAAGHELPEADWDESEGAGRLRLVQIPENRRRDRAHKKAAIEKAVAHARGEIILTTDADCLVPVGWARSMAAQFTGPEVAFVSGPVAFTVLPDDGLFIKLQAMDFFGVMACGAGGIGLRKPSLANGANVGYRRETFEALDGFSGIDHVTSGDDELLMQKIAYTTPLDIRFCASPDALVTTEPVRTLRAFNHQRRRWASKSLNYPAHLKATLAGIGLFFGSRLIGLGLLVVLPGLWPYLVGGFALKAVGDLSVLVPAARRFGQVALLRVYPLHLFLHPPQAVIAFLRGPFGGFEWKSRHVDQ